jgi:TonB family protein
MSALGPFVRTVEIDFRLPEKLSRWHLVRAEFRPPVETTRPVFANTKYPSGTGISSNSLDEGRILGAIGRLGEVTLDLDIDEHGMPVRIQVRNASPDQWGSEAIVLVRQWRFKPGMKGGIPAVVPATLHLVWGPRSLGPSTLTPPPPADTVMGRPIILLAPPPDYPADAQTEGVHGTVVVSLIVDEQGVPGELRVSLSLDSRLDRKALEAVAAWRFQPMSLNGQPVSVPTSVEVSFGLPKR